MATAADRLAEEFSAEIVADELSPHYNLAPTQQAPIVADTKDGKRQLSLARFGLVPHWAEDLKIGNRFLNARVETAATSGAFKGSMVRHRCLVIADGFYEWRKEGKRKIPWYFQLPGAKPFGMAGLWAAWKGPDEKWVRSFSILTMPAMGIVASVHDRMPILLEPDVYAEWLSRDLKDTARAKELLERHRGADLEGWEVSTRVNDVHNDDESLCERIIPAS